MKIKSNNILVMMDVVLVCFAAVLASSVEVNFGLVINKGFLFMKVLALLLLVSGCCCYIFGLYHRLWQYAGAHEVIDIVKTVSMICAVFFLAKQLILNEPALLEEIIVIWIVLTVGLTVLRFAGRFYKRLFLKTQTGQKRVLIVGAGGTGAFIARSIKENGIDYLPVGFVDDDSTRQGMQIYGITVMGNRNSIPYLVKKYLIQEIIIAIPSASPAVIREIVEISKGTGAKIKMIPGIKKILRGEWSLNEIRDVQVEDLLRRNPVETDLNSASWYLKRKTVLVTGAGGSIGSEICRQIARYSPDKLILVGHGENSIYDILMELQDLAPEMSVAAVIADIQDKEKMRAVFQKFLPQVVFHAAAHKHVPFMELHPEEAWKNNIMGTYNVAEASREAKSEIFVFISSDKAVNPTNILGATKKIGEILVRWMNGLSSTKFVAVRFGNVLGSRGSVVPLFKKQIAAGGPVTITHPDMVRFFMTIPEAVQLVVQAGAQAKGGEIFVLDMGQQVKILDLACDLISLSGLEPGKDIEIKFVGSRPGEKLEEELLTEQEKTCAIRHNKLVIVPPEVLSEETIEELRKIVSHLPHDYQDTVNLIKRLIPEFPDFIKDRSI